MGKKFNISWGGCKPAYGTLDQETRIGHWSAGSRSVGIFPTDGRWGPGDGGDQTLEGVGEIHRNGQRGGIWEEKREEAGKMLLSR